MCYSQLLSCVVSNDVPKSCVMRSIVFPDVLLVSLVYTFLNTINVILLLTIVAMFPSIPRIVIPRYINCYVTQGSIAIII